MTKHEKAQEKLKTIIASPFLWAKYFLKITDKQGKLVPFIFNNQQTDLINTLSKYNAVLKSRQLGITSVSCALSLFYCHTEKNVTCLLMSYSLDSARGIFDKLKMLWTEIPDGIRLKDVANNKTELKFVNGSRIIVCTCGTKDVARGLTVRFAHLSEYAFFNDDRAKKNLLALEQALRPDGNIIIESTANGFNHFSELWNKAKRQENMYIPHFYGWVEDKVMFEIETREFAERYIKTKSRLPTEAELDEQEKALFDSGASIEQLVWRKLKIANSSEEEFRQEFPSNAIEAFVTTGKNVFNVDIIHQNVNIAHPNVNIPLQFANTSINFWKLPIDGERYYIGVDSAEGTGNDNSCIQVLDKNLYQCAELYSNRIKPYRLAEILLELAIYYNNALCVIEKASAGHVVVDRLKNLYHYHNLYKSKTYDATGAVKKKVGWDTTSKTRPILINDFAELFDQNQLWINSKILFGEMQMFVDKGGRMEHAGRTGDDAVFAFGLAIQGFKSGVWYTPY